MNFYDKYKILRTIYLNVKINKNVLNNSKCTILSLNIKYIDSIPKDNKPKYNPIPYPPYI